MKYLQSLRLPMAVFVLALVVRILYNLSVARNYTPVFDAALYDTLARNLVDHGCYCLYNFQQSVSRPPLWPFVMASIYSLAGKEPFYARLFYCVLGSGTCVMVFLFARDLFGRKATLFSGILAAFYPCLFIYDGWLYTESLYTFLLMACVYLLYTLQYMRSCGPFSAGQHWFSRAWLALLWRRWAILCGVVVGLAALTRPNGVFLIGLVAVWGVVVTRAKILAWKIVLQNVFIIICVAALFVLPWTYRNYQVTHTFVFVSTGAGEVLKGAYNDIAFSRNGQWSPLTHSPSHDSPGYTPASDAQDISSALTWIRTHMSTLPYLLGFHFVNMWIPYTYSHGLAFEESFVSGPISILMIALIYVTVLLVMAAAILGLICTWKRYRQRLLVVYLLLAFIIAQNVVFYSDMRFRAPIEPLLILLAGGALWWLMQRGESAPGRGQTLAPD